MITLKDYMETINYRVTEGSEFCWKCFGPNAYRLDSWSGAWNNTTEGYTISVVFDTVDQSVYEIEAWDYTNNRAYRWTNPEFVEARTAEAKAREIDPQEAWDDVGFVDLDVAEDFLEKARAIVAGEEYDTRVQVPIELDNDLMFFAMKAAHEQDITFNQFMEDLLRGYLDTLNSEQ